MARRPWRARQTGQPPGSRLPRCYGTAGWAHRSARAGVSGNARMIGNLISSTSTAQCRGRTLRRVTTRRASSAACPSSADAPSPIPCRRADQIFLLHPTKREQQRRLAIEPGADAVEHAATCLHITAASGQEQLIRISAGAEITPCPSHTAAPSRSARVALQELDDRVDGACHVRADRPPPGLGTLTVIFTR